MEAYFKSDCCRLRFISHGFFSIKFERRLEILSLISEAAAFVNVTIRSLSASTGFCFAVIFLTTLSANDAVLPEPAAAETKIFLPVTSIAFFWSSVQTLSLIVFTAYFFILSIKKSK